MILEGARQAINQDGAEVICLGCAGMAGLDKQLEEVLEIPVIDGVVGALKLLEGLVGYGVRTSKRRAYATPARKELLNLPSLFDKPYQ
jgi:allantoin racemase